MNLISEFNLLSSGMLVQEVLLGKKTKEGRI